MKNFIKKIQNIGTFLNGFVYGAIYVGLFILGSVFIYKPFSSVIQLTPIEKKTLLVVGSCILYFLLFFAKGTQKKSLLFSLGQDFCSIVFFASFFVYALLNYQLFCAIASLVLLIIFVLFFYISLKQIFLHNSANNVALAFVENDVKAGQGYNSVDFEPFRPHPSIENIKNCVEKSKNHPEVRKGFIEDLESVLALEFSTFAKTKDGNYYRFYFDSKDKLQKFLDENTKS